MDDMPRPRPPHLQRHVTRHGKVVWYVRIDCGPLIRIKGDYGSESFMGAYHAAVAGTPLPGPRKPSTGTLAWLLERYRETDAWSVLSIATRRQRENIFRRVVETAGREPYTAIDRKTIIAGIERRKPYQGRHFLDAMRGLFRWAAKAGHVNADPTAGVDAPAKRKGGGFPPWTEDDVARFEARWPVGTKERVWLDVLQYTGLRRGDAVQLGRQHIKNGVATIRTEKSQDQVTVTIPILPVLQATLDAGPCGELAFICGAHGTPMTKEGFGNEFRKACRAAGVRKSAHGLRKIGAQRAAENGATVNELEAIFGWSGGRMASHYTREADRVKLAKGAIGKLARNGG